MGVKNIRKFRRKTLKYEIPAQGLRYGKVIIESDADVSKTAYERLFA